jgi:cysteine desulfuration protein SufE
MVDFQRITETFRFLDDWESRYQFIIELGSKLPAMEPDDKIESNRVHGCMSMVWIKARTAAGDPSRIELDGDSDTSTVKGLVAILVSLYQGRPIDEVAAIDADEAFESLGLFDHLSPTRHVGVYAMVEHIKAQARELLARSHAGADSRTPAPALDGTAARR